MFRAREESRIRDENGSGITEVMISLVILSVSLLSLAGTSVRVGTTMNSVHSRLSAMQVAERQIETLYSTAYDEVTDGSVTRDGVQMTWAVAEGVVSKRVTMVYRYDLPRSTRQDTLVTAVRRP
ncbi:MAG: hypothetical protein JSU87_15410 [Gemmatimonadota bacterium]|nr:MAG: hypothetical protein JSU87_15410 [Gemmatimonadota bacterium]